MIRVVLVFTLACVMGLVIQATLVHTLAPAAVAPDVILILVLYLGLYHRSVSGLVGAFLLGLAGDFASAQFLGPVAGGAVVAFGIVAIVSQKVYAEHFFAVMVLTFMCTVAKSATFAAMLSVYVNVDVLDVANIRTMMIEAALTAVVAPFVIKILAWSDGNGASYPARERLSRYAA